MVRSIFQHCSIIWRPTTITLNEKVERIQKKAMKWILGEEGLSYSCNNLYLQKCKELKILPMKHRFELVDLLALHKIIHGISPISLPEYLKFFSGRSRLRFCHLDNLSLVSDLVPNTTAASSRSSNAFANSFFYRSHLLWNEIPIELREVECPKRFKSRLKKYFFDKILRTSPNNDDESLGEDLF